MRGFSLSSLATSALAITILAMPVTSFAKQPIEIAPSSQWHVDFAPNKCRLARTFGEGAGQHLLFIEQYWPESSFGLIVAGQSFKHFRSRKLTRLSFKSGQEPLRTEPFKGDVQGAGPAVIYGSVDLEKGTDLKENRNDKAVGPPPQLDAVLGASVEFIALSQRGKEVRLNTGPLGDAFKVLNQCTKDLLTDWGLDAEKHLTARSMPKWKNQSKTVRRIASKYPSAALIRGEQTILSMRVMVDETGAVTDCVLNEATSTELLESPACEEMKDAEFAPAVDAEGQPFKSYYANSIIYRNS